MSTTKITPLTKAFLQDHRRLTRMLSDVVSHLKNGDGEAARSLALELDQLAGPHIEFEESVLYPAVEAALGPPFERKLQAEHDDARCGLMLLLSATTAQLASPQFQKKIEMALRAGLQHAESCGTLVSHLEQFSEEQQQHALTQLKELKKAGGRWTGLRG